MNATRDAGSGTVKVMKSWGLHHRTAENSWVDLDKAAQKADRKRLSE
jgi:hypothetical protein